MLWETSWVKNETWKTNKTGTAKTHGTIESDGCGKQTCQRRYFLHSQGQTLHWWSDCLQMDKTMQSGDILWTTSVTMERRNDSYYVDVSFKTYVRQVWGTHWMILSAAPRKIYTEAPPHPPDQSRNLPPKQNLPQTSAVFMGGGRKNFWERTTIRTSTANLFL